MSNYVPKAVPTTIKFNSRASIEIKNSWYTFEYGEERQIQNFDEVDLQQEIKALTDHCNSVVDGQIEDVLNILRK